MTILDTYNYLVLARRDLWTVLKAVPDDILSQALTGELSFPCFKDIVFHIITCEDGWIPLDILRVEPELTKHPELKGAKGRQICDVPLESLVTYWKAVEQRTLSFLETFDETQDEIMSLHDAPEKHYKTKDILWHVMIHEMRHSSQIAILLRSQGIKPPSLDFISFLSPLTSTLENSE